MKRIWQGAALVLCLLGYQVSFSQYALTLVKGTITPSFTGKVSLYGHAHGHIVSYSCAVSPASGAFAFAVPVAKGEFDRLAVIRDNGRRKAPETLISTPVYIRQKQVYNFAISISEKGNTCTLARPSLENALLQKWRQEVADSLDAYYSLDAASFVTRYAALGTKAKALTGELKTAGVPGPLRAAGAWAEAEYSFFPLIYVSAHKPDDASDDEKVLKPVIDQAVHRLATFSDAAILQTEAEKNLLSLFSTWLGHRGEKPSDTAGLSHDQKVIREIRSVCSAVENDTLKGYYMVEKMSDILKLSADSFQSAFAPLEKYLVTADIKQAYDRRLSDLRQGKGRYSDPAVHDVAEKGINVDDSVFAAGTGLTYLAGTSEVNGFGANMASVTVSGKAAFGQEVATAQMIGRQFFMALPLQSEGYYDLKCNGLTCRIYLKPGDRLKVAVSGSSAGQGAYSYSVLSGSPENVVLQKWYEMSLPLTLKSGYRKLYLTDTTGKRLYCSNYAKVVAAAADLKNQIHTGNAAFDASTTLRINADLATTPLMFLQELDRSRPVQTARLQDGNGNVGDFLKECGVSDTVFNDARLLQFGEASEWLNIFAKAKLACLPVADRNHMTYAERVSCMVNAPGNDALKAQELANLLHSEDLDVNNLSEFNQVVKPLQKYTVFRQEALDAYNERLAIYQGDTAYIGHLVKNIVLPDKDGKPVSLRSFKGKVVLIDVWGTWCGPCKAQIPFLKEVEEDYKANPDIVFIGLALERKADEQKWKNMVKQMELKGTQLVDLNWSNFARPYGITAIPRFMLMDRDGNWIEIRCPLPENKEKFENYINNALRLGHS